MRTQFDRSSAAWFRTSSPRLARLALPVLLALTTLAGTPAASHAQDGAAPKAEQPPAAAAPQTAPSAAIASLTFVVVKTNKGEIVLKLDAAKAPISVANFVAYAKSGHYDGTVFHRVIPGFMIQGGGFTEAGQQKKTGAPIANEWQNGLKNMRGTIAMARTNSPNSATSQFFINHKDNPNLDQPISGGAGYAVFGEVVAGIEVVDAIAAAPTGPNPKTGMPNWPKANVVIEKVEIVTQQDAERTVAEAAKKKAAAPAVPATPAAPAAPTTPAAPATPAKPAAPAAPAAPATPTAPATPAAPKI